MKIEEVRKLPPLERWLYWISERESIRLKRLRGEPAPWTDDVILQRYRFCNVRRMDDKVSQWLLKHWYEPNFNHPNTVLAIALARFINLPSSLEAVGFPRRWEGEKIKTRLRAHRERGYPLFNGAYMVRGNDGVDKVSSVVDFYLKSLVESPLPVDRDSMENTHRALSTRYGFGSFMAGQVVADLRWAMEGSWKDQNDWAPIGPGSKKGMNLIQGRPETFPLGQPQFLDELREIMKVGHERLPAITSRLEAIDWQNTCCELSKYEKALWNRGRPKAKYNGAGLCV